MLAFGVLPLGSRAQGTPRPATSPASPASPASLSQYTTADALWFHIQNLKKGPTTRPTTAQQYQAGVTNALGQMYAAATEFGNRYPDDPRKWDARLLQIQTGAVISRMSGIADDSAEIRQLQELSDQKDGPPATRGQARSILIAISLRNYRSGDNSVTAAAILDEVKQFAADFPSYPSLDVMKYKVAQTLNASDPAAAETLLKELAGSGEGRIADEARKELAARDRLKSPLELHFTAVDGSQVDISKMRGKVVLVDFWATWCAPCKAEEPSVVAAYNKLHDKGFEVVGISLDMQKESLLKYTADNGMKWPQYFDGKEWQNAISSSFGIHSIPTMWLVNKKGYVVNTDVSADLAAQVEKLLAEDTK